MLLRIRFDDPGWFANDPRLGITVDGASVYDGAFTGGVVASVDVPPGTHRIATSISILPGLARRQEYTVDVPAGGYREDARGIEVRLSYSRLAGNFKRTTDTRRIDGDRR
jgi:hypothetical protein